MIHIRNGKGGRDRDVPLSPKLLEDAARVLALDEAEDLVVPRIREGLASRRSDHGQSRLARLQGGGQERRYSRNGSRRICSATATRPICWKPAPI